MSIYQGQRASQHRSLRLTTTGYSDSAAARSSKWLVDPLQIIDNTLRAKVGVDVSQSPIGIDQMIAAPARDLEKI